VTVSARARALALRPAAPGATLFGVLGDFGVDAAAVRSVVGVMRTFGRLAAVVTTGDNAYRFGRPDEAAFGRRILDPLVTGTTRLYASLGDHDVHTDDGASVLAAMGMPGRWYSADVGPVEVVVLDTSRIDDVDQGAFLRRVLARRRTPWRAVVLHRPPYECSFRREDPGVARRRVRRSPPRLRAVHR
jgi:hypothetical protein